MCLGSELPLPIELSLCLPRNLSHHLQRRTTREMNQFEKEDRQARSPMTRSEFAQLSEGYFNRTR